VKGRTLIVLAVASSFSAAALHADQVDELIKTLKPSPVDYAVWAQNLLGAAGDLKDNPVAQVRLYEKAYDYGLKNAKGYPTAIKAAQALLKAKPQERLAWQQKLLAALKLDWQAADRKRKKEAATAYVGQVIALADDLTACGNTSEAAKRYTEASRMVRHYAPDRGREILGKLKDIRERQQLREELVRCRRLLKANPKNLAVRERLIRLHVVELDEPAEADKLLTAEVSEELRTYVPMASGKVESLSKEACLEMGDWYRSLGGQATGTGKEEALTRAWTYYERFMELETDAVKAAMAKAKLAQVGKELAKARLPQDLRRGLVLYYSLDEHQPHDVADLSGKGNHGKVHAAKLVRNARRTGNGAYECRDSAAVVSASKIGISGAAPRTVAFWARAKDRQRVSVGWGPGDARGHEGRNFRARVTGGGGCFLWGCGPPYDWKPPYSVQEDTWFHHAVVYDGSAAKWYVGGSRAGGEFRVRYDTGDTILSIGSTRAGLIDEVMIWKRALSASEVRQLYWLQVRK